VHGSERPFVLKPALSRCSKSILELCNGDVYVGSTNDLKRRYASHKNGDVASTRSFLPAKLKCYIGVETEAIARSLERYFKSGSGKAFAKKRFWQEMSTDGLV